MSQANLLKVTDASFSEQVLQASGPVLLKFEADWCGPCQSMKPAVGEIVDDYAGRLTVASLDIDANPQTTSRYAIRGVPTVMLFKDGQVVAQKVGLARKVELAALIDSALA